MEQVLLNQPAFSQAVTLFGSPHVKKFVNATLNSISEVASELQDLSGIVPSEKAARRFQQAIAPCSAMGATRLVDLLLDAERKLREEPHRLEKPEIDEILSTVSATRHFVTVEIEKYPDITFVSALKRLFHGKTEYWY